MSTRTDPVLFEDKRRLYITTTLIPLLRTCGFRLDLNVDYVPLLRHHLTSGEDLENELRHAIIGLLANQLDDVEKRMNTASTRDEFNQVLDHLPISDTLKQCLMNQIVTFKYSLEQYLTLAALRTAADSGSSFTPPSSRPLSRGMVGSRGRQVNRVGQRNGIGNASGEDGGHQPHILKCGTTLECRKRGRLMLVYVRSIEELEALQADLGPLVQMHGTNIASAKNIADCGVDLDVCTKPNEFSPEKAFYTTPHARAAVARVKEKNFSNGAVVFFNLPSSWSVDDPLSYRFGTNTDEERRAWKRLIRNNYHNENSPLYDGCNGGDKEERVYNADIVEGPICFAPKAVHISLMGAYTSSQVGYLTPHAVGFLNRYRVPIVAVFEGDWWGRGSGSRSRGSLGRLGVGGGWEWLGCV
ncbi:hypothetical protein HK102_002968 [Quaeritorhiza haematococci]|nr:hypothetical protein HK102_002968 [Quaeritorhiza haematococci]